MYTISEKRVKIQLGVFFFLNNEKSVKLRNAEAEKLLGVGSLKFLKFFQKNYTSTYVSLRFQQKPPMLLLLL